MGFSEEQIRDIVSIKEGITGQIMRRQEEIDMLEKNLAILDEVLKGSSFSRASQLGQAGREPAAERGEPATQARRDGAGSATQIVREDGSAIASARVTDGGISIAIDGGVHIGEDVPPFRSFFMERIVGDMRRKDDEEIRGGRLEEGSAIECTVSKRGTDIAEITIRNHRTQERADELVRSAGWSLKRMLEKAGS